MIRLEQMRLDAFLTADDLGELVGVSPKTIRRLEESGRPGHMEPLRKLAAHFEMSPSELLAPVPVPDPTREAA